jgi:tRNA uridine 5-carboxymethylaminomethyl modification enzyme
MITGKTTTLKTTKTFDAMPIPHEIWELELNGVSHEAREKLRQWQPGTLGQASRIAGVSPSDVAVLLVHLRRLRETSGREAGISR